MFAPPPPPPPPTVVAPGAVIDWSFGKQGRRTYRAGPYRLAIGVVKRPERYGAMATRLEVADPAADKDETAADAKVQTLVLTGAEGFDDDAYARFAVARLDPASPVYSVVVTSYTGGAHCCDDVQIATPTRAASLDASEPLGWSVLRPGPHDGAALGWGGANRMLEVGGTAALVIPDDRFNYVFGCFACSYAPIRIVGLRRGVLLDRTAEPAFRPVLEADMRKAEVACRQGEAGACPGYLADAARLGRWEQGWRVLQASIRTRPQWNFPDQLCDGLEVETKCRPGQTARAIPDYATSVRLFLKWLGYPTPATSRGPR